MPTKSSTTKAAAAVASPASKTLKNSVAGNVADGIFVVADHPKKMPTTTMAMSYSSAVTKKANNNNNKMPSSSTSTSAYSSSSSSAVSSASSTFSSSRDSSPTSIKCRSNNLITTTSLETHEENCNKSRNNYNNKNSHSNSSNNRNRKCHPSRPLPQQLLALAPVLDSDVGTDDVEEEENEEQGATKQPWQQQHQHRRWKRTNRGAGGTGTRCQQQKQKKQQQKKMSNQFARHHQQQPQAQTQQQQQAVPPTTPNGANANNFALRRQLPAPSNSPSLLSLLSSELFCLPSSSSSSSGICSCAGTDTPPGTNTPLSLVAHSPPAAVEEEQQQQLLLFASEGTAATENDDGCEEDKDGRQELQQQNTALPSELLGQVQLVVQQQQQQQMLSSMPMPLHRQQQQHLAQLSFHLPSTTTTFPRPLLLFPPSSAVDQPHHHYQFDSFSSSSSSSLAHSSSSPSSFCCQSLSPPPLLSPMQMPQMSVPNCAPGSLPPPPAGLLLDLSHPVVCQFYLQQRHFFRQIYAQQLAALSACLGLTPPPERLIEAGQQRQRRAAGCGQQMPMSRNPFTAGGGNQQSDMPPPPHQHLGFPPAPPPPGHLIQLLGPVAWPTQQVMPAMPAMMQQSAMPEEGNTSCSSDFYQISCMDVLSEHIFNFKQNTEQSTVELNKKLILRDQLYYAISPIFPMCGLYIVGSSLNGFGTKHSDLDLCLMITNRDIDQRSDAVVILSSVMRTLENSSLVIEQQLILAKVPILRIKCTGAFEGIIVDLNVNNSVAIRNTHLMSYYSGFDWRVRPIVMVVKEWAKCRGINNASHSSFTSYSLVLMVIHYLQCGADPPVLPSLQKIYSNRFSEKTDVRLLNISQPLEPMPSAVWNFDQRLTLSDLLLGFLHYYAYDFNFDQDAISIRTGQKVNRAQVAQNQSPFNTLSQWHCICIEEPFTLSNAAHSIYDQRIFNYIKESFMKSYIELNKHRDLNQFLAKPTDEEKQRLVMALPQQIMMIPSEKIENGPINHTNCCL